MFHVEQFLGKFLPDLDSRSIVASFSFVEQEYMKWNRSINVSSIRSKEGFWEKHVLDSLSLVSHIRKFYKGFEVYDVGSGGGFPGLVLAVCLDNSINMVEPIRKKTDFIDHCVLRLGLKNARTINDKYESIKQVHPKTLVVSRALGEYDSLYKHFRGINPQTELVLMTTTKQKHGFKVESFTEEYDFINVLTNNSFKDNVLARVI